MEINQENKATEDIVLKKLETLNILRDHAMTAMTQGVLKIDTYVRFTSAIEYIKVAYKNVVIKTNSVGKLFPYDKGLIISFKNIFKIAKNSRPVEYGGQFRDVKVKDLMDIEIAMINKFLKYIIGKENKQIEETDIDNLLKAIEKADSMIDGKKE